MGEIFDWLWYSSMEACARSRSFVRTGYADYENGPIIFRICETYEYFTSPCLFAHVRKNIMRLIKVSEG